MPDITRRSVLAGVCGGCAAALAGCATYGTPPDLTAESQSAQTQTSGSASPTGASAEPAAPSSSAASSPAEPGAAPGAAAPKAPKAAAPAGLAQTSDIPVGGGKIFAAEKVVITQPVAGKFKAFSTTCTHAGCAVTTVSGETINCPCHGSAFAIADGSVAGGPAPKPLPSRAITVADGSIALA